MEWNPISYLESSFLSVHVGLTKRATLESSVTGSILIGFKKGNEDAGYEGEWNLETYVPRMRNTTLILGLRLRLQRFFCVS